MHVRVCVRACVCEGENGQSCRGCGEVAPPRGPALKNQEQTWSHLLHFLLVLSQHNSHDCILYVNDDRWRRMCARLVESPCQEATGGWPGRIALKKAAVHVHVNSF